MKQQIIPQTLLIFFVHPLLVFRYVYERTTWYLKRAQNKGFGKETNERPILSVTENLIRSISNLIYKDSTGYPLYVPTFLTETSILNIPIVSFNSIRFFHTFLHTGMKV